VTTPKGVRALVASTRSTKEAVGFGSLRSHMLDGKQKEASMLVVKVDIHDPRPSPYRWYIYDDERPMMWMRRSDRTFTSRAKAMGAGRRALHEMLGGNNRN